MGERDDSVGLSPLVVWRLIDGKPGHENQSLGLCNALAAHVDIARVDIRVEGRGRSLMQWLAGRFPAGDQLAAPDLILGAGHLTHFSLLAARRRYGGRAVVIMRPSLPASLFDLCIVPEHDRLSAANVFQTRGVMNRVRTRAEDTGEHSLILLGGPSRHFAWDQQRVVDQVKVIVSQAPGHSFLLSDSRRTPDGCLDQIRALGFSNLNLISHAETESGWVSNAMASSLSVWVTEDSVSMVYEALTSGARVGLIELGGKRNGRVTQGVAQLLEEGWVTPYHQWLKREALSPPPSHFNEAQRCAAWMVERWL